MGILSKLLFAIFIFLSWCFASFEKIKVNAKAEALGEAFTAVPENISSIYYNPSSLAQISSFKFLGSFACVFDLEEIKKGNFCFAFPIKHKTSLAFSWSFFYLPLYKEQMICFSYAKKLVKNLLTGINFKYFDLSIETIGKTSTIGFDGGILYLLPQRINIGFFMENINQPLIGEKLPLKFGLGFLIKPYEEIFFSCDFRMQRNSNLEMLLGTEFKILKELFLRYGFNVSLKRFSFGVGFKKFNMDLNYACVFHNELFYTHTLSFIITK